MTTRSFTDFGGWLLAASLAATASNCGGNSALTRAGADGAAGRDAATTASDSSAPVTVVPAAGMSCQGLDLALANGVLYWADQGAGTIEAMDLASGVVTRLASGESSPTRVSVRGPDVYWLNPTQKTIRHSRSGIMMNDAITSTTDIRDYVVSADGRSLYFSTGPMVREVPTSLGPPVDVAFANGGQPVALALDGDKLVMTVDVSDHVEAVTLVPGAIASCDVYDEAISKDLSVNCVRLAQGLEALFLDAIALAPGHAFWADGPQLELSDSIDAYGKDFVADLDDPVSGITIAGDWAYVATGSNGVDPASGVIYKVPAQPNQVAVPIARGQVAPRSLVTDGKKLYWSTSDCAIEALDL